MIFKYSLYLLFEWRPGDVCLSFKKFKLMEQIGNLRGGYRL